jgi:hypothetical protein
MQGHQIWCYLALLAAAKMDFGQSGSVIAPFRVS